MRENEEVKARDYIKKSIRNTMHLDIKRQKQGRQVLFLFYIAAAVATEQKQQRNSFKMKRPEDEDEIVN